VFRGTEALWELLSRKNVNTQLIGKEDLKTLKKIILTTAHLTRYQPGDKINITRGKIFRDVIELVFAKPKGRSLESTLLRRWVIC